MAKPMANAKPMALYTELIWRKAGEERCDWTPMPTTTPTPTEKKALGEEPSTEKECGITLGVGGLLEHPPNKREAACAKMNERYLVGQPIQNPFMPNSNYANDLEVQMNFLTPTKG